MDNMMVMVDNIIMMDMVNMIYVLCVYIYTYMYVYLMVISMIYIYI